MKLPVKSPSRQTSRLLRSYGPMGIVAAAFVVMAATVPAADRDHQAFAGSVQVPTAGLGTSALDPAAATTDPAAAAAAAAAGGAAGAAGGQAGGGGGGGGGGGAGVQPCTDRTLQVAGDPYSPPCFTFSGDNGGATAQGVTADSITVTVRQLEGPTAAEIFASISGEAVNDSAESVQDTVLALAEYFSKNFQFYGRKLNIQFFRGEGNGSSELLGGGKERALADAVRASKEFGTFADLSAITLPYADALAQQGVVNFGAPYPSRAWFEARRPYSWSLFPDGTNVVRSAAAVISNRQPPGSVVEFAPDFMGQPRVYGLVAPENAEYQESVQDYLSILSAQGYTIAENIKYKPDISSMPNQASNIIAQLKDRGVTTVICGCDPVMLALGMTPKANEQGYNPEWMTSGLAFADQDIVAQLIDDKQWARAYGIAYNAESEVIGGSYPYAAYKSVRPNDEPAFGVEELYYQMYMLAIGIQMAGPTLNPQTIEAGMFAYPGGSGPRGLWGFGPGDYTPTDDFREIWWDPNRISPQNNKAGAWVQLGGGARWTADNPPKGPGAYFKEG